MFKYFIVVALLVFVPFEAYAKTIKIDGGGVVFNSPVGFEPLSQRMMRAKFPSNGAPQNVIGNSLATTTIAYDIKNHKLSQTTLGYTRDDLLKTLPKLIPGLVWKQNKIIRHSGQKWIYLEMTSKAVDTGIYNIMMVTDYKGKMLMFNFNSTIEDFTRYERELRKSIFSIEIK